MSKSYRYLVFICLLSTITLKAQTNEWKWKSTINYPEIIIEGDTLAQPPAIATTEDWWAAFGYPELIKLQEEAIKNNFDLKVTENNVNRSKALLKASRASIMPSISLDPSFLRQEFSANRPIGFDAGVLPQIRQNNFSVPLNLSYELDILGKNANTIKASGFDLQSSEAARDDRQLQITSFVAQNFFALLALDTEFTILERTLIIRQDNLDIVTTRFNAGLVNEIDLQRAKTELATVEVQAKGNRQLRAEIELALAVLCGKRPGEFAIDNTLLAYLPPVVQPVSATEASTYRPDLTQFRSDQQAAQHILDNSRKQLYPSLFIRSSFGYVSENAGDLFQGRSRTWLVGGTISIPLFEGFRRRAQLEVSRQELNISENVLEQRLLEVNQEIENILSNIARLNEQLTAQRDFQLAAQQAAIISKQRYTKGLVTYLEVVDAERVVLDAERLSVQLLGQLYTNTVRLIVAMGGKFD
ncbi:MAG: efflux transporter outer membrane subunit [Bacteroidota bacterium]